MKSCAIAALGAAIAVSLACGVSFDEELIDNNALELGPDQFYRVSFELPDEEWNCRLTGRIVGLAGRNKDFTVLVLDDDGLANWEAGEDAAPFFQKHRIAVANLDVPLAGPGPYHLVISNAFSVFTTKTIQAKAKLTCTPTLEISGLPETGGQTARQPPGLVS